MSVDPYLIILLFVYFPGIKATPLYQSIKTAHNSPTFAVTTNAMFINIWGLDKLF
jgi:hypothetical protein